MVSQQSRASSAVAELGSLERELTRLGLLGHAHGNHVWAVVETARDELQAAEFAAGQIYKYEHSLARLRTATQGLQDNKKVFESTLQQVRNQLTAANRAGKRGGGGAPPGADGGAASSKDGGEAAVPGPFTFSYEKLQKRSVFAGTAEEAAAALATGASVEPDPKKRAKVWAKATFVVEMVGPGEFALHAMLKKDLELWCAQFTLDEFLKQRFHGVTTMEVEGVKVNIGPLLDLINEKFVMGK